MFHFKNPTTLLLAGPTMSGKTEFIFRFIKHLPELCPELRCVTYFYDTWQSGFEPLMHRVDFKQGVPTLEDLKKCRNNLVILDDLMEECKSSIFSKIYTIYAHHYNFSVLLTTQNLFNKNLRQISLNSQIVVLFKNVCDTVQIANFFRQIYPKKSRDVLECYKTAVREPYSYLLVDLRQTTFEADRLRSSIFPDHSVHFVYR